MASNSEEDGEKERREERVLREEVVAKGDWLALKNIYWIDHRSKQRVWEGISRTTKGDSGLDCVGVVPVVRYKDKADVLITVKQFRPALGCHTIEMPAGLVDPGESPEDTVTRELFEETGLRGQMKYFGPCSALNPGLGSDKIRIAFVVIDGDARENRVDKKIHGVDGESIEVFPIPLADLRQKLREFAEEGLIIDSRLDAFAFGLDFHRLFDEPKT